MPRLFFAIPVPETNAAMLFGLLRHRVAATVRLTEPMYQHITVHFLGSMPEQQLPELCERAALLCEKQEAFTLSFTHLTYVPSAHRPQMIWLQGEPHDAFNHLVAAFRTQFPTGEQRPPLPHVTLARMKTLRRPPMPLPAIKPIHVEVHEIHLWQSLTLPQGARYEPLHRWPLLSSP
ncbi:MAG: RNA 2',3'-cyclic phosphodiesterase [Chitinophagales bacterium]|nr:RNA 2',3'-cyclic phosphodiesterase [Chitinophagales bacterium]MDW8428071.1 RNA 2',3'-cyclic phosphodiesterase [Chitinophagales bacterium]